MSRMAIPADTDVRSRIETFGAADRAAARPRSTGPSTRRCHRLRRAVPAPDWTVGHVVTHLARNADGLRRVLVGATAGRQVQPYDSPQARADDIEAGAPRGHRAIAERLPRPPTTQLATTIDGARPEPVGSSTVDLGRGGPTTADVVLAARLGEVRSAPSRPGGRRRPRRCSTTLRRHRLLPALLRSYVRTRDVHGMTLQPDGRRADRHRRRRGRRRTARRRHRRLAGRPHRRLGAQNRGCAFPNCRPGEYGDRHEQHTRTPAPIDYTGHVEPRGAPATRELADITITKLSVGPMDNNAYLLVCKHTGERGADRCRQRRATGSVDLLGSGPAPPLRSIVTTHRTTTTGRRWQAVAGPDRRTDVRRRRRRAGHPGAHRCRAGARRHRRRSATANSR